MHLASLKRQKVTVAGERIDFRAGETIHTENSYKYTLDPSRALRAAPAGRRSLLDRPRRLFLGPCAGLAEEPMIRSHVAHRDVRAHADLRSRSLAHAVFRGVVCPADVQIPTEDSDAWLWYPRHRWVYDKVAVALSQGLDAGPHGVDAAALSGVLQADHQPERHGRRQPRAASAADYDEAYTPGHMWMTLLDGRHVSLRRRGASTARRAGGGTSTGEPGGRARSTTGPFTPRRDGGIEDDCGAWIAEHLAGYTGILNLETIGGRIIEVHLRFATSGRTSMARAGSRRWCGSIDERRWDFADADRRDGYSVVLFGPHGRRYRHPPQALLARCGNAGRVERADHVSRGQATGTPRHAAWRLSSRDRERLRPGAGRAAREMLRTHFLARAG